MKIDLVSSELCLSSGKPIRLTGACGVRVRCLDGTVWITKAGMLTDMFLGAGESYLIDGRGLVLVESISDGRVLFEVEPQRNSPGVLLEWLRCTGIKLWNKGFTVCPL
jgi:hypothetical protein